MSVISTERSECRNLQLLFFQLLRPRMDLIADPTGTLWHTAAILRASAFVSIVIVGSFAFIAWLRIP
ncbi:MAG TPA: hypothetical protein VK574_19920 [Terracidiphilus sp.]|nr:hypothetical protein [Terracidiphilus sp.]